MLRTLFVDFNSFFASVEQQLQPHLRGRPVGVVIDRQGNLLVADDVGNVIWRVSPAT